MNQQRLKAKNSMLRFYTLQDVEYGRGSSNFGQVLQVRVMLFHKVLNEMRVELPIDSMISKRKMNRRVERCCLLFKSSERILQALHDLRKLGEYIQMIRPVLMPLDGYTQDVLKLGFDLDHVFLVDYVLKAGKVVDISGFHSDYLREIEILGNREFNRLKVDKIGIGLMDIEEAFVVLNVKRSSKKTLFPGHWDWLRCLDSALEALKNALLIKKGDNGELVFIGLSKAKIAIQLIIDGREKVITFYPNITVTQRYAKGRMTLCQK